MPLAKDLRPGMRVWIDGRGMKIGKVDACSCGTGCGLFYIYPENEDRRHGEEMYGDNEVREMRRRVRWETVPVQDLDIGDRLRSGIVTRLSRDGEGNVTVWIDEREHGPFMAAGRFSRMRR